MACLKEELISSALDWRGNNPAISNHTRTFDAVAGCGGRLGDAFFIASLYLKIEI